MLVYSLCPFLTDFRPGGILGKRALGALLAHGVLHGTACSDDSQAHSGTRGKRGQAKPLSLTLRFHSVSRLAGRVRRTGDTLVGGAVEAVFARAVGFFAEVVDGLLKVAVCCRQAEGQKTAGKASGLCCAALTCVAVPLTETLGLSGEFFLIFAILAFLALRLQTVAQRHHTGPWNRFTVKRALGCGLTVPRTPS